MQQEILNFKFSNKQNFFVSPKNYLAFNLINSWPNWKNQCSFLYGPKMCGKTTLCNIWKKKSKAFFLDEKKISNFFLKKDNYKKIHQYNWIIDDIDLLISKKNNEKLLNLMNILLEEKKSFLLMTSKSPPKFLNCELKDLSSRLSSSLVVEVNEPDNELLFQIIEKYLKSRSIKIDKKNIDYLTNRIERSYKNAVRIATEIDKKSLENHSSINFSFLKKIINKIG